MFTRHRNLLLTIFVLFCMASYALFHYSSGILNNLTACLDGYTSKIEPVLQTARTLENPKEYLCTEGDVIVTEYSACVANVYSSAMFSWTVDAHVAVANFFRMDTFDLKEAVTVHNDSCAEITGNTISLPN